MADHGHSQTFSKEEPIELKLAEAGGVVYRASAVWTKKVVVRVVGLIVIIPMCIRSGETSRDRVGLTNENQAVTAASLGRQNHSISENFLGTCLRKWTRSHL